MGSEEMYSKGSEEEIQFLFGSIYKKYQEPVYRLALSVTKSHQQADDIAQEVFMKLWEHRNELHDIASMDAWLSRVVKNKLIDFMRKAAADNRLKASLWKNIEHKQHSVDHTLEAKESDAMIRNAVEELPRQRKLVYRLNRENGLSYREIADELSISRHTVKNQLTLAIRFLQKKFSFQ